MPVEDAERWDQRYREDDRYASFTRPRPFLIENAQYLPPGGLALDVAMGLGGNASFLLSRGLRVIGVDISSVAVRSARERLPGLFAVQADLTEFHFPAFAFDVILNFYYLQRDLWPLYERSLRTGGVLILETLAQEMRRIQPDIDPSYLLSPGELRTAFPGLETLVYREGWTESESGHPRAVASLVARKPVTNETRQR